MIDTTLLRQVKFALLPMKELSGDIVATELAHLMTWANLWAKPQLLLSSLITSSSGTDG